MVRFIMVIMVNWPVPTPRSGTQGEISMGGKAVIMVNLPRLLEVDMLLVCSLLLYYPLLPLTVPRYYY